MKKTHTTILLATMMLLVLPTYASADSAVVNVISVSSNSGDNTAENGKTVTGSSKSSVRIKTTVNGEIVTDMDETSTEGSLHVTEILRTQDNEPVHTEYISTSENERGNALEYGKTNTAVNTQTSSMSQTQNVDPDTHDITHLLFIRFFINYSRTMAYVLPHLF